MTIALYIATFIAGTFVGFITAAMLAVGKRADDYEPVENKPPRNMPRIIDGN